VYTHIGLHTCIHINIKIAHWN